MSYTVNEYHAGPGGFPGRELLSTEYIDVVETVAVALAERRWPVGRHTPFGSTYLAIMDGDQVHAKVVVRESREPTWRLERT